MNVLRKKVHVTNADNSVTNRANTVGLRYGILSAMAFAVVTLIGCAQSPPQPTYAEQLAGIPYPQTSIELDDDCAYFRQEIVRQQNIAQAASVALMPMYALAAEARARSNIAAVESRAAEFGCPGAFSSPVSRPKIESCIEACKANTKRTSAQCFDACNHQILA